MLNYNNKEETNGYSYIHIFPTSEGKNISVIMFTKNVIKQWFLYDEKCFL